MSKIKFNDIISFLTVFSMLLYAFRGKLGAIVITVNVMVLLILTLKRKIKNRPWNVAFGIYLMLFAVILHSARSLSFEYYLIIGYMYASLICFNNDINIYRSLWKYLKYISIFEAFGVYLQKILPSVYYSIISIILPNSVVTSIQNRLLNGYYTGFSREVSYTMFFIVIGLGIYIFDIENRDKLSASTRRKRVIAIIILFGALFMSGKRATLLFFLIATFITYFLRSDDRLKLLKYLSIGLAGIGLVWVSFPIWSKIPAMERVVELIGYIGTNDLIGITNGRTQIYEYAINLWNQNKLAGIGWGNFKYLTSETSWFSGFDVHNCFLQLLCENGYIGAIPFYILMLGSLINSLKCIVKTKKTDIYIHKISILMAYIQIFFIEYCLTEPILYEYTDYIIYFISVNIIGNILKSINRKDLKFSSNNVLENNRENGKIFS